MIARRMEISVWAATTVLALVTARGWRSMPDPGGQDLLPTPSASAAPAFLDSDSLDEAAVHVVEHDPFRLERRPSDVPYAPGIESAVPPPPAPPKPALLLTGIMGGPPWQGVIEGLPGTSGSTVVREGQSVGELRVVRVTRELVVVEGADTTWTLRVRRAW